MEIRLMIACAVRDDAERVDRAMRSHASGEPAIAARPIAIADAGTVAATMRPDVALLELDAGLRILPALALASPGTAVLLYGTCAQAAMVQAIRAGACGCAARSLDPRLLVKAVRTVHGGAPWFGRSALLQALRSQMGMETAPAAAETAKLTQREEEILRLIGQGLSNKEIGRRLDISDHTVKTHLHRVYAKLHQSGRYKAFLAQARA